MSAWSSSIANRFIGIGQAKGKAFTQMQLQKLVYIAHGWNLAINGNSLTYDNPEAWEYGPVYKELRTALRKYGSHPVSRKILNSETDIGAFRENLDEPFDDDITEQEAAVIKRVEEDYGKFHAFKLSALTHQSGTPWSEIYADGAGRYKEIPAALIREHFVGLARN